MKQNLANSPLFNVTLFTVFWAIQIFISKLAYIAGADFVPFAIQSSTIALFLLIFYILIFKRDKFQQISKTVLIGLLIANAIHGGLGYFFSNAGYSLTTTINAGFLIQFGTVTTSILAWIILKERMTASKVITIVIIMVGTFLLITKGRLDIPHIGDLLILFACLSWSTGNVLIRRIVKKHPVDSDIVSFFRPIAGLPVIFGFILLAPLYPPQLQRAFHTNLFNFNFLFYTFFSALFLVLLWIFLNRTLKIASASYMTMMSSLTPVLVAILALVFLKESLEPVQWFGAFLITISGFVTFFLKIDKH